MNPWPLVVADFRSNRTGVVAIVLLVALAIALGIAVSAQERAVREGSIAAARPFDLLIGARGSETQLLLSTVYLQPAAIGLVPGSIMAELERDPGVAVASPIGFGDNYRGHPIVGVTPAFVEHLSGGAPADGRVFARLGEAVAGAGVDVALGTELHAMHGQVHVEEEAEHDELTYRVVGRLPRLGSPWDHAVVVPIEAVWWTHSLPFGHEAGDHADFAAVPIGPPWAQAELSPVPAIAVRPKSFAAAYELRQRYRARDETMAIFPAEVLVQLHRMLGNLRDLLAAIAVMTQTLVIGAVLLAVLASLAQRRRLIAVLRALGASRGFVFATVWLAVAVMLVAAALLGTALGWLGALLLSRLLSGESGVALAVGLSSDELALTAAIVAIGLLLATIPALLSYRGSVSSALRSG